MNGKVRRVVTGHDAGGKAIVIADGLAPAVRTNPLRPGHVSVDLWKTAATPAILQAEEPDPTLGPKQIHPPFGGTVIRISEIAPETEAIRNLPPEQAREVFKSMGNEDASTFGHGGRHHPAGTSRGRPRRLAWRRRARPHCGLARSRLRGRVAGVSAARRGGGGRSAGGLLQRRGHDLRLRS